MKILITGATGLIGSDLVQILLKENHSIHYLTTSKKKIKSDEHLKGFYWNPNEGKIDPNCIIGVDVIVHLAGVSISKRWTESYKQEIINSRIDSTNLLYSLIKKNAHQVKHFISASGTAIYPDSNLIIYDESFEGSDTSFLGNVVTKWEQSADQFEALNIKVSKMRTGIVFSEKGGAILEMIKPIAMFVGADFGSGNQMQSWIHLTDLANMYYFVIKNQIEGVINAVAPNYMSFHELNKTLASVLKRPLILPNIPKWIMNLILGENHVLLFSSKMILAKKVIAAGFKFQFPTIKLALEDIVNKRSSK